jgi:Asp-tRNA(Asn)/Glu-tRNA(Gln) amidotransferase A subunit family amidase
MCSIRAVVARTTHDLSRTPGGGSGGEAAVIAAGGSPLGPGTDIGGSGRLPASFTGIASIRPTAGRLVDPGRLSVPIGERAIVSQVAVFARFVPDVALGLAVANTVNVEPEIGLGDYAGVEPASLRIGFYTDDGIVPAPTAIARRRGGQESPRSGGSRGRAVLERSRRG